MKLEDAIKTGKRIRSLSPRSDGNFRFPDSYRFSVEEILHNEYEVEPDPRPRMYAWIHKNSGRLEFCEKSDGILNKNEWKRAPWLDGPEEK